MQEGQQYSFRAEMTCEGCAKAIRGTLSKVKGVAKVETDVTNKRVTVTGTASKQDCMNAVKGLGKAVSDE